MTIHGTWVSYSGTAEIVLAIVLATAAAAVAYAGIRLPLPARPPRRGRAAKIMMLASWVAAIAALLVCSSAYVVQAHRTGLHTAPPITAITPITLTGAAVLFFVIARAQKARGESIALGSAVIGTAAGLMIFELPFDLIIMARTYPVIDPALFRLLLFGPLILVAITTLALLPLSPAVQLRKATLWCLAGMLAIFAVWSLLFGFSYPSAPGPITLNALSKILALVTALTLFLPGRGNGSQAMIAVPLACHEPRRPPVNYGYPRLLNRTSPLGAALLKGLLTWRSLSVTCTPRSRVDAVTRRA